jgi:hypothetical protein
MTATVYDNVTKAPMPGVSISTCSQLFAPCDVLGVATTDDAGLAPLSIPTNASGYGSTGFLSLSDGGIVPEFYYWGFPLSEPTVAISVPVIPSRFFASLLPPGAKNDPTRGYLALAITDCIGTPSPEVRVSVVPADSETTTVYFDSKTGNFSSGRTSTDGAGIALVADVLAGPTPVEVRAIPDALGRPSGVISAYVAAGTITLAALPANQ